MLKQHAYCTTTTYRSLCTCFNCKLRIPFAHRTRSLIRSSTNWRPSPSFSRLHCYPTHAECYYTPDSQGLGKWIPSFPYDFGTVSSLHSTWVACGRMSQKVLCKSTLCFSTSSDQVCSQTISEFDVIITFRAGSVPSRLQLLLLDFAIILLNMLLSTIAYEISLQSHMPANTPDPLLPISPLSPSPSELQSEYPPKPHQSVVQSQYVLDLRLRPIYERLTNPTPTPPERRNEDLLPLPNTTGWQLPGSIRMLVRAGERARLRTETPAQRVEVRDDGRTVPGGLDTEGRG